MTPRSHKIPGKPVRSGKPILKQFMESQERLRTALEYGNIGVFDWNPVTNKVIFIGPGMAGENETLAAREVDASHWMATTHPDDIARAREAVERAVRGDTDSFSIRYRMQSSGTPKGEWTVVHSRGRVKDRDRNGRATRLMGIFENITHLAAREEADRMRDAHLARATKVAALGELALSLAHEINQPLATLTAYLQAADQSLRNEKMSRPDLMTTLRRSERQAQRVADIVRRLRSLYRDQPVADEDVDLVECLQEVFQLLRREIETHAIEIKLSCRLKRLVITGDRLQIEQVLYNIVRNSVDVLQHYGAGRGAITVLVQRFEGRVGIRITDNGPGIPANIRDRMFEPFFTTKPNGTGLGLSISRSIIEAHRGRLKLETRRKRGATFVVELPIKKNRRK